MFGKEKCMKKVVGLLVAITVCLLCFVFATCSKSSSTTSVSDMQPSQKKWSKVAFTYADINAEGSVQNLFAKRWAETILKATEGNFVNEIYPSGTLAKDDMDALLQGVMDMFPTSPGMIYEYDKRATALEAPMIYKDVDHAVEVLDMESLAMKSLNDVVIPQGFRILTGYFNGVRQFGTKKPIYRPSDLVGLKIRIPKNIIFDTFFTLSGASTVSMSRGELPTALLTNVVNGMENSYHNIWVDKTYEIITYISEVNYVPSVNIVVINEKRYQTLDDEYKKIMHDAMQEASKWISYYIRDDDIKSKQSILESGKVQIITEKDGLDTDAFQKIAETLNQSFSKEYWEDMIDLIRNS
jgi:TRAP-type C4-dicarboxylate transport system substrate-binding protein